LRAARTKTVKGATGSNTRDLDAAFLLLSFATAPRTTGGNGNVNMGAHLGERFSNVGSRSVGLPAPTDIRWEETVRTDNSDVTLEIPQGVGRGVIEKEATRETIRRANEIGIRKEKKKWVKTYAQRCEAELPYIQAVFATYKVEQKMATSVIAIFGEEFNSRQAWQSILSLTDCSLKTLRGLKCSRIPGSSTNIWATEDGKIQSRFRRIREVHNRRESVATYKKRRGLRDRPLTKRTITEYAVEFLYKAISTALVASKRRSNECVFNMFGYCFVPWSAHTVRAGSEAVNVNQGSMKFIFKTEDPYAWHNTNVRELFGTNQDEMGNYEALLTKSQSLCAGLGWEKSCDQGRFCERKKPRADGTTRY